MVCNSSIPKVEVEEVVLEEAEEAVITSLLEEVAVIIEGVVEVVAEEDSLIMIIDVSTQFFFLNGPK